MSDIKKNLRNFSFPKCAKEALTVIGKNPVPYLKKNCFRKPAYDPFNYFRTIN